MSGARINYGSRNLLLWTDDNVATLRSMWADGHSAGAIADRLGTTRNSVLGKRDREGLTRPVGISKPSFMAVNAARKPVFAALCDLVADEVPLTIAAKKLGLPHSTVKGMWVTVKRQLGWQAI